MDLSAAEQHTNLLTDRDKAELTRFLQAESHRSQIQQGLFGPEKASHIKLRVLIILDVQTLTS